MPGSCTEARLVGPISTAIAHKDHVRSSALSLDDLRCIASNHIKLPFDAPPISGHFKGLPCMRRLSSMHALKSLAGERTTVSR